MLSSVSERPLQVVGREGVPDEAEHPFTIEELAAETGFTVRNIWGRVVVPVRVVVRYRRWPGRRSRGGVIDIVRSVLVISIPTEDRFFCEFLITHERWVRSGLTGRCD